MEDRSAGSRWGGGGYMLVRISAMGWNAGVPDTGAESGFTKQGPQKETEQTTFNGDAFDAAARSNFLSVAQAYTLLWLPSSKIFQNLS